VCNVGVEQSELFQIDEPAVKTIILDLSETEISVRRSTCHENNKVHEQIADIHQSTDIFDSLQQCSESDVDSVDNTILRLISMRRKVPVEEDVLEEIQDEEVEDVAFDFEDIFQETTVEEIQNVSSNVLIDEPLQAGIIFSQSTITEKIVEDDISSDLSVVLSHKYETNSHKECLDTLKNTFTEKRYEIEAVSTSENQEDVQYMLIEAVVHDSKSMLQEIDSSIIDKAKIEVNSSFNIYSESIEKSEATANNPQADNVIIHMKEDQSRLYDLKTKATKSNTTAPKVSAIRRKSIKVIEPAKGEQKPRVIALKKKSIKSVAQVPIATAIMRKKKV
jgi:hypothetical protein